MSSRKKKAEPRTPEAPVFPIDESEVTERAAAALATWGERGLMAPQILEYKPASDTQPWRVEKFQDLVVEFELRGWGASTSALDWMRQFHEAASGYPRGWQFIRKLFGVHPLIPADNAQPDDLRVWTRDQLLSHNGLQPEELRAEFDMVRVVWGRHSAVHSAVADAPLQQELGGMPVASQEDLLKELGFSEEMFEINVVSPDGTQETPRPDTENKSERAWFIDRINSEQWKMMLRESRSSAVARSAVLNELALRRLDRDMSKVNPRSPHYPAMSSTKGKLSDQYQNELEALNEMFPELSVSGKVQARVTIAGLVQAIWEYKANKDNDLIDGIRTAHEIDIELSMSVQTPLPSYRQGQNTYLLEAIHHLFDPNFRSKLRPGTLRVLDKALPQAMAEMREALSVPLPDLEKAVMPGEGDDFEDFPAGELTDAEKVANL